MRQGRYPSVILTQNIEETLRAGHPWVFADAVRCTTTPKTGDVVDLVTADGNFVGRGLYEAESPIRVRLWTTNPNTNVDNQLLEARIKAAAKRRPFPTNDHAATNGYRLLNGENDLTPGVTCDIYDRLCVLRIDGCAAERWIKTAVRVIKKLMPIDYIVVRRSERYRGNHAAAQWLGKKPPEDHVFTFQEYGVEYLIDPINGQKTGFFLDQRANRQRLAELCVGKRLLNLFAYTGGFSLAAAVRGAAQTTSVDLSEPAISDARRNFERNGIPSPAHHFVVQDVFQFLDQFEPSSAPYEVVVCDPPSFAHKRDDLERATEAYVNLFAKVIDVMPNGAKCALASCSSQIDRERFLRIVAHAGQKVGTQLISHGLWAADIDHPSLISFPEGDYLQFTILSLDKS